MIYEKDMNIYDNHIDNFRYKHKLERDKKYKLPYMEQHGFRRERILINGNIEDIYLSTWNFRMRNIDNKKVKVSIMEYPNSYVLMISHWIYGNPIIKFYEGLDYIPTWGEIEKIVKSDF
ncbi:MAG: hypothetical protein RSC84_03535 [Peptostreptococcaceae bacterium]